RAPPPHPPPRLPPPPWGLGRRGGGGPGPAVARRAKAGREGALATSVEQAAPPLPLSPASGGECAPSKRRRYHSISPHLRLERLRPHRLVVPVLERHRHHAGGAIDGHVPEQLHLLPHRRHL